MNRLAENNRILLVEAIRTVRNPFKKHVHNFNILEKIKVRRIKKNLYILTPGSMFLPGDFNVLRRFNYFLLSCIVKNCQTKLEFSDPIFWMYIPEAIEVFQRVKAKINIFMIIDEYSAHRSYSRKYNQYLGYLTEKLAKNVDIVFVTARGLLETKKHFNRNTYLIPNGCDYKRFADAYSKRLNLPRDIREIHKPILGFIGGIGEKFDLDLIEFIAKSHPEWSIVLIGPIGENINLQRFDEIANVHFLGRKDLSELPNYLQAFDVCLNPTKLYRLTEFVNPLKIYEYLAMGKPVVSVDMAEVRFLKDVVRIATSYNDFVEQIKMALDENSDEYARKRIEVAKQFSWENLLEMASSKIENYMKSKNWV